MDYKTLYKEYDKAKESNNIDEMNRIKGIVDKSRISEEDTEFQAYPDIRQSNFNEIIYKKKEFHSNQLFLDVTGIEETCGAEFSIKSHQQWLIWLSINAKSTIEC